MWKWIALAVVLAVVGAAALALFTYRSAAARAETAFADIERRARPAGQPFDDAMLAGLPEVAQRYFRHAIAPGTPLSTTVKLEMEGAFLLGDATRFETYALSARQILTPPSEFVWIPVMSSGWMRITGSDALVGGEGWTQFWINGLVPVVNQQTSPDLIRSALARPAMESIWAPASLLPSNGVQWVQTGANMARVTIGTGIEPVDITLDETGRVLEVVTMRWSDVNADKVFRLQPFGGTIEAESTFGGFTIPSRVKVGNHFGTVDFLPFFQASIISATYL